MAKKITLTVPDALYQKINEWRSGFNMSRIFQDAVSEAIRKKEEFQKRISEDKGLADIIERLKQEKSGWEEKIFLKAEEAGQLWASRAHYEDLLAAVSASPDQILAIPNLEVQMQSTLEQLQQFPSQLAEGFDAFRENVLSGWKKGVDDFWEVVRDKI
jgi:post-segregation antitoxin (ccd killing protein)